MNKRLLLAVLLSTQIIAGGFAQQPTPSPRPTQEQPKQSEADDVVRITTNLVQVDAVITDKDGKPVTDLKPEEMELFEDGRKQKITNLSFYVVPSTSKDDSPAKPAVTDSLTPPPTRLRPEDVRRTIAIVVDDLGLSFESIFFVRRALKKFVDEQMQPGDLVAILRTRSGRGALQQFTSDKRLLYAAIEGVRWYANGRGNITSVVPFGGGLAEASGPADSSYIPGEDAERFREDLLAVGTLGALSYVVRGLRDLPGRKSVLLVSPGFKILNRDDLGRSSRVLDAMRRLADQANRAAVVINTMDARGLEPLGFNAADNTSGARFGQTGQQLQQRSSEFSETQDGLIILADITGGIAFRNNNDLNSGIRKVLENQKSYYLIGYRPDIATFDPRPGHTKFHKLSLKVTRPGTFKVHMRNGFYGVSDQESPAPRTPAQQLVNALTSPFGATGIRVQLTSLFANDPKLGPLMRSILYIDPRDLTFAEQPDGKRKCIFDLVALTVGADGRAVDQIGRTYTVVLVDDEYKRVMREGLVYYATVPIKNPGAYQLRVSLRDSSTERVGSASQFVEAPDITKKRLVLSGLIIRGENAGVTTQTETREEGLEEGDVEASPAIRRLKPGMVANYAYFIYNARIDKASSRPQITTQIKLFRDGKEVFAGNEIPFDSSGQTDLQRLATGGAIQLGSAMEPGEYLVQVIVTDPLADKKHRIATQWMDFQIVK